MIDRQIRPLTTDSFFIFGPRGVGKTTLLRSYLNKHKVLYINLLNADEEEQLSLRPELLRERINASATIDWIVIDEIQKIPKLLDVVHNVLETPGNYIKFALTGSSARKLKKYGTNLLAGRAFINIMFPFLYSELREQFNLKHFLLFGGLPKIYSFDSDLRKQEFLRSYAQTYLKEEIWAEHMIRNLDLFRKFLELAAQSNGEIINFSKIAKQIGTTTATVQSYFDILEETLVGFFLESYTTSVRKRIVASPKFYFFDTGVKRALDRTIANDVGESTYEYGKLFETFILTQIRALISYSRKDYTLHYIKTKDGAEIDLVIDRPGKNLMLIEIKSSKMVLETELKNLKNYSKDLLGEAFCVCQESQARKVDGVLVIPWQQFLDSFLL